MIGSTPSVAGLLERAEEPRYQARTPARPISGPPGSGAGSSTSMRASPRRNDRTMVTTITSAAAAS